MILYHTSSREQLITASPHPCALRVCSLAGRKDDHLCFATEPLPGMGKYAYSVDIPETVLLQYEYANEFRVENARFFALPKSVLELHTIEKSEYESITARPWNKWTITVLDRRSVPKQQELKGKWAVVWASRKEVVSAKVYRKIEEMFLSIEVTTTSDFDPEKDYIVVEHHEESDKVSGAGVKETWELKSLAGCTPQWAIFPKAWQTWVWDRKVTRSATEYILQHVPSLREEVAYAMQKDSKQNKARAWRIVSDEIGRILSRKLGEPVDLGKLAGHSWTAVAAMPHRIANRMSQKLPYPAWVPPLPQPEYANPDESGRYALANLHGPYPLYGPGVDHAPQERPYTNREGELDRPKSQDSFRVGRSATALALA